MKCQADVYLPKNDYKGAKCAKRATHRVFYPATKCERFYCESHARSAKSEAQAICHIMPI